MKHWKNLNINEVLTEEFNGVVYTEEWLPIIGYEERYMVSNFGRIKSLFGRWWARERMNRLHLNQAGYPCVRLCKGDKGKTLRVHRLMSAAFIDNPENKKEVNHIDGDKTNGVIYNLEWNTRKENQNHSCYILLKGRGERKYRGALHKQSIPVIRLSKSGEFLQEYDAISTARRNGFKTAHIGCACKGKRETTAGFKWMYKSDWLISNSQQV
jgi:hypothetical protein